MPADGDGAEEIATETESVAPQSDNLADDNTAVQPASTDHANDVVDFSDAMPDNADAAEPAEEVVAADDVAAQGVASQDVAAEEPAMEDATAEPSEAEADAEPTDLKSTEVNHLDADKSSAEASVKPSRADDGMRLWTDNTGKYQVRARLVMVHDGKVRLQKETGRFTTVPFQRLSMADLAFVRRLIPALARVDARPTDGNTAGLGR